MYIVYNMYMQFAYTLTSSERLYVKVKKYARMAWTCLDYPDCAASGCPKGSRPRV